MNAAHDYVERHRITDAEALAYEQQAEDAGSHVVSILEYHSKVRLRLLNPHMDGDTLPWPKTVGKFRLREGEVTLWHGINGHGKSALTGQVAMHLALLQARKVCLASFEMSPETTLERMCLQAAGNPSPSAEFIDSFFFGKLAHRMWIYDRRGRINRRILFAAMRYAAEVKGCTHFFVDSLIKCVPRETDYDAQSEFVDELCGVAHQTGMHVHLIHHVRKGADESQVPGKFDARGTGAITDQVDNVVSVWRNKAKERERDKCLEMGAALMDESPDFLLTCDKQRNGKWEGVWGLWSDAASMHFRETKDQGWTKGYDIPKANPLTFQPEQEEPGANG